MKLIRFLPEHSSTGVSNLAWLEIAELLLKFAYDLFAWSKRLRGLVPVEWAAVRLLQLAVRALGHAPAETQVEFRADMPVRI